MRLSDRARPGGPRKRPSPQDDKRASAFWKSYLAGGHPGPPPPAARLIPSEPVSEPARAERRYNPAKPLEHLIDPAACQSRGLLFRKPLDYGEADADLIKLATGVVNAFRKNMIPMYLSRLNVEDRAFALGYYGDHRKMYADESVLLALRAFGHEVARRQNVNVAWYEPLIWRIADE